ncbi:transglutaminase family protein [Aurantimonas sp. MSK8Z-1]|uniref:transglutaminase family protein n=1 Tax=Mangrovibrevibacter kandeliae TaxID=2968473 RepID=UPI0021190F71|nr:transglutaminase family protein [Aurantimonas sp. MSK8Z-1]MCW4113385.1 transglutaminase family protein [Aurantimonas sp. MSK8Z-1]
MQYDVTLFLEYLYPQAVVDARHRLCATPRRDDGQRVLSAELAIRPEPDELDAEADFFGNATHSLLQHRPHERFAITMTARVAVARQMPVLGATPPAVDVAQQALDARDLGPASPLHFVSASRAVRLTPSLAAYARETLAGYSCLGDGVLALARRIRDEFAYRPGVTDVTTEVAAAFERREGVCQDFAQVMIAALRGAGIPAAYVGGFLRTDPPPGQMRILGIDQMHAWVKVWLGETAGWAGFDPTNGILALDDHIELSIGRDYADAPPVSGVLTTSGQHFARHYVDVIPWDEPPGAGP